MHPQQRKIFLAATLLGLLGFISFNIYLPAIPDIVKTFHSNNNTVKHSLTLFLFGFSLSQFFWGSLSSKHGRKTAVLWGLIIANIGTLCAYFSPTIDIFNSARLIEGLGAGSVSVLCRALITDALDQANIAKAMSVISSLGNIMPAIAPLLGSYIILLFHWRTIFIVLFIFTIILFIFFLTSVKETNLNIRKDLSIKHAYFEYHTVFTSRKFVGYIAPYLALSGGMIGYNAATPFIFINQLHISAQHYSYLLILTVVSYVIGAHYSGKLQKKFGFNKIILTGTLIGVIPGVIYYLLNYYASFSIATVTIPMMMYTFAAGLVAPIANACALTELRNIAGAAAAVIGASVYAAAALSTIFITNLNLSSLSSLGLYVLTTSLIALGCFYLLILRSKTRLS